MHPNYTIKQHILFQMKKHGSISDFVPARNRELLHAYRKVLEKRKFFDIDKDFADVVNTPCSRYWISEERAAIVISSMLKGSNILDTMRPTKREMFLEIFFKTYIVLHEHPDWTLRDCVFDVVNSPARKFYMKPRHAREILYRMKKGYYNKD